LLDGRMILARSGAIAARVLPAGRSIAHAFNDLFEQQQLAGIESRIAEDIARRAETDDIAYVVPGLGWIGDATVSELTELASLTFADSSLGLSLPAHTQVTDALTLAQAQQRTPFDAGSHPLDATVPTVVLNWHGQRIIDLASIRLRTIYGETSLPNSGHSGVLRMPARDQLDAPPSFAALEYITARLRQPDGCPWDREQTHESLLEDFASEVEEYAEAVRSGDWQHAAEELGDVLLNVMMQSQIGVEAGHFSIEDVLTSINAKLVRRHPHVFGAVEATSPEEVLAVWNSVKQQEKSSKVTSQDS
jgi:NTP pyrophosphatase (non-canonical NTP hydrolase)